MPAVRVSELAEPLVGLRARGKPGDLMLTNGRVSLVVERSVPEKRRPFLGQPIDLWSGEPAKDRVEWLGLSLQLNEQAPKAVSYQKTEIAGDMIRSTSVTETNIQIVTEYSMRPNEELLHVKSSAKNVSADRVSLSMCSTGYLGNHQPWIPGEGFVPRPAKLSADWIGFETKGAFYSLSLLKGTATVQTTAVVVDEAIFYNGFLLCNEKRQLAPQEQTSEEWLISLSSQDLAAASAALLEQRGETLLTVSGQSPQGSDAQWVDLAKDKKPYLRAALKNSRYSARIPAGEYEAYVSSEANSATAPMAFSLNNNKVVDLPSVSLGLLEVQVTEKGEKTPARIILYPEGAGSITPLFHSVEHIDGSGNCLYSRDGSATVALSPGWYRVLATRGMEYDLPSSRVEIKAGQSARVALSVTRVVDTSGAVASDLHLHSGGSRDSNLTLEARVTSLIAEGVEVAVATEHENIVDYGPVVRSLGVGRYISTIVGEEVTTAEPNWGHFNVFPIDTLPDGAFPTPVFSYRTTPDAIFAQSRELSEGDEIVQVNHPRMEPKIGYFSIAGLDPKTGKGGASFSLNFDTIEIFNGLELAHLDKVEQNLQDWYSLLNIGAKKVATGSSDSHILALQEVGYPRTYVFLDDTQPFNEETFISNLKKGRAMVTNGPFLRASMNGVGPGEVTSIKKGERGQLNVEVRVAPWVDVSSVEVIVNGASQAKQAVSVAAGVAKASIPLAIDKDSWVVVIARGDKPLQDVLFVGRALPIAFQNPIWVMVQ